MAKIKYTLFNPNTYDLGFSFGTLPGNSQLPFTVDEDSEADEAILAAVRVGKITEVTREYINGGGGGSTVVEVTSGIYGLETPMGVLPLTLYAGTPHEGQVNGIAQQVVTFDAGSDIAHPEILVTFQATAGDPDVQDNVIASTRFVTPDGNVEVFKTQLTGAEPQGQVFAVTGNLSLVHFALRGSGSYTVAAANAVIPGQMVLMRWNSGLAIETIEFRFGPPTGTNGRSRQLTLTGYSAAAV